MSTRLTQKDIPMIDSQSLKLIFGAVEMNDKISHYLSNGLKKKGYKAATASVLNFLGTLECGVNYGSEIARSLGVSRQMVAKTVKELCRIGYLVQVEGSGKQKQILFTELGEQLMSDSRLLLAELDAILCTTIGQVVLQETIDRINNIQSLVPQIENT